MEQFKRTIKKSKLTDSIIIVVKDMKYRTCQLIEMSVSTERNIYKNDRETFNKFKKFKDLEIEIDGE